MFETVLKSAVRIGAFVRKEVVDVLRQPRLVATLIVGPFAILALFGIGYRTETPTVRAVFVADPNSELAMEIEARIADEADEIALVEITDDLARGERLLQTGDTDIVVIAPRDPVETIKAGEQAEFVVLHDQLDPFEQATLALVARTTIDSVNRRVVEEIVRTGQVEAEEFESALPVAIDAVDGMRVALEAGNVEEAQRQRIEAITALSAVEDEVGGRSAIFASIEREIVDQEAENQLAGEINALELALGDVDLEDDGRSLDEEIAVVTDVGERLREVDGIIGEFRSVDAAVLVSPFDVDTTTIAATDLSINDFYAPGVIALLLQHLAITFAGLSFVREQQIGAIEVFRMSPIRTWELVLGKFLGYFVFAGIVAVALSALTLFVAGTPLAGSTADYVIVVTLLIAASLGVGFLLSTVVTTDSQAINLAMIVLLISIFFSGFFLSLDRLEPIVRWVSWSLPITHAIDSLRDVMFRGTGIDLRTWVALGGGSVVLFALSSWLVRRKLVVV